MERPEIKIGDAIVCKNTAPLSGNEVAPPLEMDKDYEANNVHVCECGQAHIDVGLKSVYNWVRCYKCDTHLPNGDSIHWCHPTRFEHKAQ